MAPATQMKFFIKDTVWKVKYSEVTHSIKFQICNTMCIMIPIIAHKDIVAKSVSEVAG